MTIVVNGFLGPLTLTRGYGSSSVVALVVYIDPRLAVLADTDATVYSIDPRQGVLLDTDSTDYTIDPRQGILVN